VILDEVNVFRWPGFDLRPIKRGDTRVDCGLLPPRFFDQVIAKFTELRVHGKVAAATKPPGRAAASKSRTVEISLKKRLCAFARWLLSRFRRVVDRCCVPKRPPITHSSIQHFSRVAAIDDCLPSAQPRV
jgi:hypothetical protein